MSINIFIDHYHHVVPFGELVKYAVQFHYLFLVSSYLFLCVT